MLEFLKMILMGIVQGVAEFLPISSSGHLVLFEKLLNIQEPGLFVAQMLHFGTFISVFIVFFNDIKNIIIEYFKMIYMLIKREKFKINSYQKLALLILVASVPTAIIALCFEDVFKVYYTNLKSISLMFLITAILLFVTDRYQGKGKSAHSLNYLSAIGIGMVQGLAIMPGISRSGSTIFAGTILDLDKNEAAKFSFLISLPATFGAFLFGLKDIAKSGAEVSFNFNIIVGMLTSMIVGVLAIKFLLNLLDKNKMSYFSIYLLFISIITYIIG
ncbi:undecaprenyl-diphosphate phosphatase [uncultured Ezakiella sp.]|uniref:undecaprenyl-diphosphate phosphatase n=1 Tax=uncultured Ezakiella sp. TaxID=1637529 RepID=UPI0025CBE834|nr:undecaprenyl-diphosphate phosphatase [uncultured Ezakiella sp.]